jgi:hypothetical protein
MFCVNYKIPYKNKQCLMEHIEAEHPKKLVKERGLDGTKIKWTDCNNEEKGHLVKYFVTNLSQVGDVEKE